MKTVWLINQFAGFPEVGANQRHFNMTHYWQSKGHKVVLISNSNNHLIAPKNHSKKGLINENGVDFYWIKTIKHSHKSILRFFSMIEFAFRIGSLVFKRKQLGTPNIIILSSVSIFPMLQTLFLKWYFKTDKFIFEVRDLWPLSPILLMGFSKWNPLILYIAWLEKLGYRKAEEIVSLLDGSENYINPISKDPSKYHCIPNGIPESFLDRSTVVPKTMDEVGDKKIYAYIGTFGFANALDPLVDFLLDQKSLNHRIHFLMIGKGPHKHEIEKKLSQIPNITFIDQVSRENVRNYLGLVDVAYIGWHKQPLYDYGVSANKYYDYMASGTPILAAHHGINDLVKIHHCGIHVENEKEAIRQGVEKFLTLSEEECKIMGEKGRKAVEAFTYENLAQRYIEVMER
jgi:glycosyltransferase involved in cell wall biosynthesis